MTISELPNDIDALKHLVIKTHEKVVDQEKQLTDRDSRIKELQEQLAFLKHKLFGRKGEKINPAQLSLFNELTAQVEQLQSEAEQEEITYSRRKGHGRKSLPEDLPTEDVVYPPESTDCPCCGNEMHNIGEEVTKELEYNPGSLFVRRHIRPKYACRQCEEGVYIAPMPPRPIDKGIAGPGLLAHVLTSKYADHIPLNRLQGMLRRHSVDVSMATMCDWVGRMADLLMPIYEGLKKQLLAGSLIQSDDTKVPYLLKSDRKQTASGYLWTYLCESQRLVLYDFTTSRAAAGPSGFLRGFSGTLLTDGYSGYDQVVQSEDLVRAGCWAHARRKYYDARVDDHRRCGQMLKLIQELFKVEQKAAEAIEKSVAPGVDQGASGTAITVEHFGADEHLALRRAESRPLIDKIRTCAEAWSLDVLPKSSVGKAVSYMLNQWKPLTAFLTDPSLPLDNNASERAMRHVVIGRNNWMFAGSVAGGHRAAIIYSVVATCKLNALAPFAYLRYAIERLAQGDDPATLLPGIIETEQLAIGKP